MMMIEIGMHARHLSFLKVSWAQHHVQFFWQGETYIIRDRLNQLFRYTSVSMLQFCEFSSVPSNDLSIIHNVPTVELKSD